MISKRTFITGAATVVAATAAGTRVEAALPPKSPMGVASTAMSAHIGGANGAAKPMREDSIGYLEFCRSLGAGGVQMTVTGDLKAFRRRLEQLDMFFEGECSLPPNKDADFSRFEKQLADAKYLGAPCVRAVCRPPPKTSGRRYESFRSLQEWNDWKAAQMAMLEKAVPVAERIGMPLALENHKDWLADEHVAVLKRFSSRHLGALIDPGNNMSMIEPVEETVGKLAPYVLSSSLKDMGVAPYEDGFLLSEVHFGAGVNDQAALFAQMRRHNPKLNPVQELITRDPLKIPVFTEGYWATWPERSGMAAAHYMELVKAKKSDLPRWGQLSPADRLKTEAENNRQVFDWARTHIKL